jgi:hypothetical protein
MSKGEWLNNVGRIIRVYKEDGETIKNHFLKFERRKDKDGNYVGKNPFPLTINEGDTFTMKPKNEDLAGLVKNGTLSQEQADKIYRNVRFELNRPPEDETNKPKDEAKKPDAGGVDF